MFYNLEGTHAFVAAADVTALLQSRAKEAVESVHPGMCYHFTHEYQGDFSRFIESWIVYFPSVMLTT